MKRLSFLTCLVLVLTACVPSGSTSSSTPGIVAAFTAGTLHTQTPTSLAGTPTTNLSLITTSPTPTQTESPESLSIQIDRILQDAGGHWNIFIQEIGGEILYARQSDERILIASVIKVPIAILFFKSLEQENIPDGELYAFLETHGNGEIPYSMLLRNMLVYSDEYSTSALIDVINANVPNTYMAFLNWGLEIDIFNRVASASDIAHTWQGLYLGEYIPAEGRQILLDLLSEYTENKQSRLGCICLEIPHGCTCYNKRGTITAETLLVADTALLTIQTDTGEKAYTMVVIGSQGDKAREQSTATIANSGAGAPEQETDYYRLDAAISAIGQAFAGFILNGE